MFLVVRSYLNWFDMVSDLLDTAPEAMGVARANFLA